MEPLAGIGYGSSVKCSNFFKMENILVPLRGTQPTSSSCIEWKRENVHSNEKWITLYVSIKSFAKKLQFPYKYSLCKLHYFNSYSYRKLYLDSSFVPLFSYCLFFFSLSLSLRIWFRSKWKVHILHTILAIDILKFFSRCKTVHL